MEFTKHMTYDDVTWVKAYHKRSCLTPLQLRIWRHARFLCFELRWLRWARDTMPVAFTFYIIHNDLDGRLRAIMSRHPGI